MQEPSKLCPRCNTQNYEGAMFCYSCSFKFLDAEHQTDRTRRGATFWGGLVIILTLLGLWVYWMQMSPPQSPTAENAALKPPTAPISSSTPAPRAAPANKMPAYAKVVDVAGKLGFQLNAFHNNGSSVFMAEAKRFIGDQEFRFVVMGPDKNRVDTIRLQAWGIQTRKARQQLEGWATETLSSLNHGQLPRDFIRQLYAGADVGDDGISNGFCNVQVLQTPITPGRPSASDRITIDLIFDKTD